MSTHKLLSRCSSFGLIPTECKLYTCTCTSPSTVSSVHVDIETLDDNVW